MHERRQKRFRHHHHHYSLPLALCVLGILLSAPAAWAARDADLSAAQARYQQERAQCNSGQSHQDRATCLKEATNAFAEAKRGRLDNNQAASYEQNALLRCNRLPGEDRELCRARMQGQGTISGSAEAGGIYRELVVREPAPMDLQTPSITGPAPDELSPQQQNDPTRGGNPQ